MAQDELVTIRNYIDSIDFTMMRNNMTDPDEGLGWGPDHLDHVEHQYKNWLFLRRKHRSDRAKLPPCSRDVDKFWHFHILDTRAYHRDCAVIFGEYHHHWPYFGVRDDEDYDDLLCAFESSRALYAAEFGEEVLDYVEALDAG